MKALITKLLALLISLSAAVQLSGQINEESPFPAEFEILSPANISGSYDYGTQVTDGATPIWGPQLSETVSGEVAWAFTEAGDSLACEPVTNDLTGKMALIRRGACNFSLKVYNAQEAGAIGAIICNHYDNADDGPNTIVNMLGGDSLEAVVIPAVFASRATCELITPEVDAGNTVIASFTVPQVFDPITAYSYHTPLSQVIPIDQMQVTVVNTMDEAVETIATAKITDPDGMVTELFDTLSIEAGVGQLDTALFASYVPPVLGEYTVEFTNTISDDTATARFIMTEHTWGTDTGENLRGISNDQSFVDGGLFLQTGSLYINGGSEAVVTFATFGLTNPESIISGDPNADVFTLILYEGDTDDDNVLDLANSFDDLSPLATGTFVLTEDYVANELVSVPLESFTGDPIVLEPTEPYYISVLYDGVNAGLGVMPSLVSSGDVNYPIAGTTPLFIDQLFTGWAGAINIVRLHIEGFDPTGTVDRLLEGYKVSLAPNPATELVQVTFDLDEVADDVIMNIYDFDGKVVRSERRGGILNDTVEFNVSDLPAGAYFMSILTPEGYISKKFVVAN